MHTLASTMTERRACYLNYLYFKRGLLRFCHQAVPLWLDRAIHLAELAFGACPVDFD